MSVDATRWAWKQKVKGNYKLILLSLADRANEYHNCYPSITRLSDDCCLDKKTVMKGLQYLAEIGLIKTKKAFGKSNFYTLIGVENRHDTSTKNGSGEDALTSTKNGTTKNGTSTKNGSTTSTKNGSTPVPKTGHKPKKNLKENLTNIFGKEILSLNVKTKLTRKQQESLKPDEVEMDVWECFLDGRKKKKASSTVLAFKNLIKSINECPSHGISISHAVTHAAEKSWASINWEWIPKTGLLITHDDVEVWT